MANKKSNVEKLNIIGLFKSTLGAWKQDFNTFTKVVLVLAVPSAVMNVMQTQGLIGEYGLLLALAWSFVIISIIEVSGNKKALANTKLSTIFTLSSSRLLQYVGVSLLLLVFALPLLAGIFGLALAGPLLNVPIYLFVPLGLAGVVVGVFLLGRYCLAQSVAVIKNQTIVGSLSESARLTKGNRTRIIIGYLLLIIVSLMVLSAIQFGLSINQSINENAIISGIVYVLEAVVFVPVFFIFQVKIFEELSGKN